MSAEQKVAIITGASQGIGAGLVKAFRDRDYRVVATSRSVKQTGDRDIAAVPGDAADPATAEAVARKAISRFGRIDTLVNNAGIFISKPFTDYTAGDFDRKVATNVIEEVELENWGWGDLPVPESARGAQQGSDRTGAMPGRAEARPSILQIPPVGKKSRAKEPLMSTNIPLRLAAGFAAGFLSVLVFSNGGIALYHALEAPVPFAPWSMAPMPPFGVPQTLSAAFFGGLWGIAYAVVEPWLTARLGWLTGGVVVFGLLPLLVLWFVVFPLKGIPVGGDFSAYGVQLGIVLHAVFGLGLAIFFRIARRLAESHFTANERKVS